MEWMPIESAPVDEYVLVACELGVTLGELDRYGVWWGVVSERKLEEATHWMPLPEPPK